MEQQLKSSHLGSLYLVNNGGDVLLSWRNDQMEKQEFKLFRQVDNTGLSDGVAVDLTHLLPPDFQTKGCALSDSNVIVWSDHQVLYFNIVESNGFKKLSLEID
mmetsp:Transcript_19667/g.14395  ORF Transcript_19667/g.14395 Transcript_19667/m.14395 type:complete len:103 (-) Transcript_19667:412-720(-)